MLQSLSIHDVKKIKRTKRITKETKKGSFDESKTSPDDGTDNDKEYSKKYGNNESNESENNESNEFEKPSKKYINPSKKSN